MVPLERIVHLRLRRGTRAVAVGYSSTIVLQLEYNKYHGLLLRPLVILTLALIVFVLSAVSIGRLGSGSSMWKGIKKALGHRSKAQKTGSAADVSTSSRSSAGLFPFDMADVDAILTGAEQKEQPHNRQLPSPAAAMTWAQLQQQLAQQHAVQQLTQQTEDSTSKRRAAAMQKRVNNSMLNPSTCLYQIKALLSLSTLFEHKVRWEGASAVQSCSTAVSSVRHHGGAVQALHNARPVYHARKAALYIMLAPQLVGTLCSPCNSSGTSRAAAAVVVHATQIRGGTAHIIDGAGTVAPSVCCL
jgi:hypothetical protein